MPHKIERGLVETSFGYIHYRTAGSGMPIVLLTINQQSSAMYLELIEGIAGHMRPIAIDYPSHGSSDHIDYQPTIADYARCVIEVLDKLGVKKANVLGEATGTAVATHLCITYPDRFEKLILVNCPLPDGVYNEVPEFQDKLRPADETGFPRIRTIQFLLEVDPLHSPMNPTQEWVDRLNRAQIECGRDRWQALTALMGYRTIDSLAKVKQPVMLLTGEFFPHADLRSEIEAVIPGIRSEVLKGYRFCSGWEAAAEIAPRVIDFTRA